MIRLARVWYNFIADYHQERVLDHARRRDRALRKLERLERARHRRQVQREIHDILRRRPDLKGKVRIDNLVILPPERVRVDDIH